MIMRGDSMTNGMSVKMVFVVIWAYVISSFYRLGITYEWGLPLRVVESLWSLTSCKPIPTRTTILLLLWGLISSSYLKSFGLWFCETVSPFMIHPVNDRRNCVKLTWNCKLVHCPSSTFTFDLMPKNYYDSPFFLLVELKSLVLHVIFVWTFLWNVWNVETERCNMYVWFCKSMFT